VFYDFGFKKKTEEELNKMSTTRDYFGRGHILYSPDDREISSMPTGQTFAEIWQGLPQGVEFEVSPTESGKEGLRYNGPEGYIYTFPSAREALLNDEKAPLCALHHKTSGGKLDVWSVVSVNSTLPEDARKTPGKMEEYCADLNRHFRKQARLKDAGDRK
jgi:hypothetical protein